MDATIKHYERVYLSDTDGWGMAWHGSYIKWLEKARTELLQKINFDISYFNTNYMIGNEDIKFIKMASLDQLLSITVDLTEDSDTLIFNYKILDDKEKCITTAISKFEKNKQISISPNITSNFYDLKIKTYASDTDLTGKIWHGNYIKWFEAARIEVTKYLGLDMNANGHDIVLPIISMGFQNFKPIKTYDNITIRTYIKKLTKIKVIFAYEVINDNSEVVSVGNTILVATTKTGELYRKLPNIIIDTYKRIMPKLAF
ncbi:hotdog domain-containing protein [Sulfurovum sp. CS9]|uniref:hotdog domain-containing protein n=1 Tax=Sulfurovum sp. CS9 TaxID=3391146 RepID=UPI0039E9D502